ncbi:hypothetical protein [Aurantiacibacter marinus]|uniref:hypothetical protein n=1 Tax=Aurantiacibacter marinus TaxID=874156 RepID=UPI0012E0193D|nr:hypothetical protein [Aurantiacibacter marinus]
MTELELTLLLYCFILRCGLSQILPTLRMSLAQLATCSCRLARRAADESAWDSISLYNSGLLARVAYGKMTSRALKSLGQLA